MSKQNNYSEDAKNFFFNEENKKKRKLLKDKYGMEFTEVREEDDPEVTNLFLDSIVKFEEAWENSEPRKLKEILNFPEFRKLDEIKPEELKDEIDKVLNKYAGYNINIDVLVKDDVDDPDYYRFLTEELPEHESDFILVEGMTLNFIYEEFHPNKKLDVKDAVEWFIDAVIGKDTERMKMHLSDKGLSFNGIDDSAPLFIEKLMKIFDVPGRYINREILFNQMEFEGENKCACDIEVSIAYKIKKEGRSFKKYKRFGFTFGLVRNENGDFDFSSAAQK